jgi:hypothetical protein
MIENNFIPIGQKQSIERRAFKIYHILCTKDSHRERENKKEIKL